MKTIKIKNKWWFGLCFLIASTGCKKFIDVNESPNAATTTSPELLFTNALNVYATSLSGASAVLGNYWAGYWGHSTSFTTGAPEKTYNFTNGDFNFWGGIYDNLNDLHEVVKTAEASGRPYLVGPSQVLKAVRFQELADLYGNIPYKEAFQGLGKIQPSFDSAAVVYDSLIILLDQAIANIKANPLPAAYAPDIYAGGNSSRWIQFANTVKLRILMRQSKVASRVAYVGTEITKILNEGSGFLSADIINQPGYAKTLGKLNPFYSLTGFDQNDAATTGRQLYRISRYLIDTLKASNDTIRMKYIAAVRPDALPQDASAFYIGRNSNYSGVSFGGEGSSYEAGVTSPTGPGRVVLGQATEAQVIFTAAESYFLQAEASERLGIAFPGGNTQTLYERGVRESFRVNKVDNGAATLLLNNSASFTNATNKLNAIIYQKWVALANFNGLEAWAELRRNEYPAVPLSVNSNRISNTKPVRLYYPQDELAANPVNVQAQGVINVFTSRLFWDIQ